MLQGTAAVDGLAAWAPTMVGLDTEPLVLDDVEIVQVHYEIDARDLEAPLPPALHPTVPPHISLVAWRASDGPLGAFSLVQLRVGCRSGIRQRGFVLGAVTDAAGAAEALASRWGYPCASGAIEIDRGYDRTRVQVTIGAEPVLDVSLLDPLALAPDDVQFIASMHLAHTPRGLRLVQVDPDIALTRVERSRPDLACFVAGAWHADGVVPRWPISASVAIGRVTLPALRYVCRPDVMAFEGTERL
jgi:hypothetical protein